MSSFDSQACLIQRETAGACRGRTEQCPEGSLDCGGPPSAHASITPGATRAIRRGEGRVLSVRDVVLR